ncbi:aldehyde oxidoreductase molybdenum-binding subunit PaoC [Neorhizobium galegae]|uniref:aldehyde oxidoreductase molybdenum-binding subunit PaoC n=1 Tax=Neorhizobium galegae TaxID=399 RepID=UPI00126B50C6|nr:aldehyde oxidoreductase molybdenum-binding subunit PaoC [Neorhizobium galegae]KAA9384112.1 xanthine dehydrogenase family protein molybdopterin-binding subunit [Neorhizobium galegae]MCM2498762.1 xanthine dehydrogenase family protein molybdopterin-binding subunit [Neorhizobium galegae]
MEFNKPADENIFDKATVIGKPHTRIEGRLKVAGRAPYAYERHDVVSGQLVGYPVGSTIAKGRIVSMDTAAARAAPGVVAVVTTLEIEALPLGFYNVARLFGGNEIQHYHQAIAVVVAETFEQARSAAALIKTSYETEKGDYDLKAAFKKLEGSGKPTTDVGDVDTAFQNAAVVTDELYHTPSHSHAMMEPHASIVDWSDGDQLTVWTSNQMINWNRDSLATTFGIAKDKIHVESPYIGGGFGGKLWLRADEVLAAVGSRAARRPVKLALPRPMMINNTTHRSATVQRIRLAADKDGRLVGIWHEAASHTLPGGRGEDATAQTPFFYAAANRRIVHHLADMNLPEASDMRAPGEASGLMALEIAMDEMAEKLGMDPVRFRVLNDTQVNPSDPKMPFSERHFVECLERGADAFGWDSRNKSPGKKREGLWLIGHGMAGAYRGGPTLDSGARVRLKAGRLIVETDMTDIGTGSYTIIAQTAAETMGLPIEAVEVRLGNSAFPVSSGSGGQFGAASSTAGVYAACVALQAAIAKRLRLENAKFEGGNIRTETKSIPLSDVAPGEELVAEDTMTFGDFKKSMVLATFGAHFVEVGVHIGTGEVRVRRMLAVCDAGRILNPVTARSQVIGGMTMGIGAALSEELATDLGRGYFVNHDLAGYEVAVHADVPHQEVIFLETTDAASTPLKAKGVGELGICGVAAAIANATYNATGIRVRDYPITLDRMIDRLPSVG